jgi:hypothetical protein
MRGVVDGGWTTAAPDLRWSQVVRSDSTDLDAAQIHDLVARATAGRDPVIVFAFASPTVDLERLATALTSAVGDDVVLVGTTTAGEIWADGAGSGGVVICAVGGAGLRAVAAVSENASADLRGAGAAAASGLAQIADSPHQVLLLLADGLVGDLQEVVRGAYDVAGARVPLVGGCAGDDGHMLETFVFHQGRVVGNAIVGVALGSPAPFGIGVRHGWRRVGEAMLVTRSLGTRVLSIDDRPALDAYLDRLDAPAAVRTDSAAFTEFAMRHPLGMSRRSGEEVRFIAGADFEERSLLCIAQVPQGGAVWIMEGDEASVLEATSAACTDALLALGDAPPVAVLAFDCIARRGVLGDAGIQREMQRIAEVADGASVAGFYTYGEIARTHGTGGFHNQTLVVLAMA